MLRHREKREYDSALMAKAVTRLCMRAAISVYIVYLAWRVLSGMLKGGSPISTQLVIFICILFVGVASAFFVYAWKEYKKALKAAEMPEIQNNVDE